MKKFMLVPVLLIVLLAFGVGSSWAAISLPTATITGNATFTTTSFALTGAFISKVNYLDGTSTTIYNPSVESIIGAQVVINGATRQGSYTFTDGTFEIRDPNFPTNQYLSANISNIVFVQIGPYWYMNIGLDASNPSTLNLSNVVASEPSPSRFISEIQSVLGTSNMLGVKLGLLFYNGMIEGNGNADIFDGLLDGAPVGGGGGGTVISPGGARTIGFWKNHDAERNYFMAGAVALSAVYSSSTDLDYFLAKPGKKTMYEKALQQLAALALNFSAGLDPTKLLDAGELEIYNLMVEPDVTSATLGEALTHIEQVILDNDTIHIENAKDLADEINNRDERGND